MRSFRLLAVAVLAIVLALSSAQNALAVFAGELSYDDGSAEEWHARDRYYAVLFSTDCASARLLSVRLFVSTHATLVDFAVSVFKDDATLLYTKDASLPGGLAPHWYTVTFSPGLSIPGDFYVGCAATDPEFGGVDMDSSLPDRTYELRDGAFIQMPGWHLMIRAAVDRTCPVDSYIPVGGVVTPVNTLAVLGPWLAIVGLVGCAVAVAVRKKRG